MKRNDSRGSRRHTATDEIVSLSYRCNKLKKRKLPQWRINRWRIQIYLANENPHKKQLTTRPRCYVTSLFRLFQIEFEVQGWNSLCIYMEHHCSMRSANNLLSNLTWYNFLNIKVFKHLKSLIIELIKFVIYINPHLTNFSVFLFSNKMQKIILLSLV